jgi:hypothetical protein
MGFFLVIFVWTQALLGWNTLAPSVVRFDPFPALVLWLFLSNINNVRVASGVVTGLDFTARRRR